MITGVLMKKMIDYYKEYKEINAIIKKKTEFEIDSNPLFFWLVCSIHSYKNYYFTLSL